MDLVGDDERLFSAVLGLGSTGDGLDRAPVGQIDTGESHVQAAVDIHSSPVLEHEVGVIERVSGLRFLGGQRFDDRRGHRSADRLASTPPIEANGTERLDAAPHPGQLGLGAALGATEECSRVNTAAGPRVGLRVELVSPVDERAELIVELDRCFLDVTGAVDEVRLDHMHTPPRLTTDSAS